MTLPPVRKGCDHLVFLLDHAQDFGHTEKTYQRRDQGDAVLQAHRTEGVTDGALNRGDTDHAQQQSERTANQPPEDRIRGQGGNDRESEGGQPEELRRPELRRRSGPKIRPVLKQRNIAINRTGPVFRIDICPLAMGFLSCWLVFIKQHHPNREFPGCKGNINRLSTRRSGFFHRTGSVYRGGDCLYD